MWRSTPHAVKLVTMLLIGVTLALTGCGQSSSSSASSTTTYTYRSASPSATKIQGADLAASLGAVTAPKQLRFAVILKSLTNQYWQQIERGVEAAAQHYGVQVTIQAASSESSPTQQLTIAQTMVGQHYDAYLVSPESVSNLTPALQSMQQQGAPIINIDDARVNATTFVGPDHELDGSEAAQYIAQHLPQGGDVAQIEGQAGSSAAILRIRGFKEGIAKYSNLNLVASVPGNWDEATAYSDTQELLRKDPNLKAIYANNDTMAVGVAKAVADAGLKGKIIIVGTDGTPQALDDIRSGLMSATVTPLPYYEGYWGVEAAVRLLAGQHVPDWVVAPAQLITADNISQFFNSNDEVKTDLYQ
jgi:ribose transport system substrate-binding protein